MKIKKLGNEKRHKNYPLALPFNILIYFEHKLYKL